MLCCAVLCCAFGTALDTPRKHIVHITKNGGKNEKRKVEESKENKEVQEGSPPNNIIVGKYRLRMAERWENIPSVSSEVGEI